MTANVFEELHRLIPVRLFTVTAHDPAARLFRRIYTSNPDVYPLSGTKPMEDDDWSRMVVGQGKTFVANTAAEFARFFFDHETITALGCHSAANVPVRQGQGASAGPVEGTVNLLDVEGWFTPERVAWIEGEVRARSDRLVTALRAGLRG